MGKWGFAVLATIVMLGSISITGMAQGIPMTEEQDSCSINSVELSGSLESETIDLSEFCNQVEKSQEFADFMKQLDEDKNKILIIPEGKTIQLNCYFSIPSNTTIQGGAIEFMVDAKPADVYNEAFIINRHSATYWDGIRDKNIVIQNVKIQYDCSQMGRSLFRFRDISGLTITGCTIEMLNKEKTNTSHNAAIDLFKGCENVKILNNQIKLSNPNGSAGGAVWIRSMTVSGNDPDNLQTSNVEVIENVITSNSCDELLAVGSSGYDTSDVLISNNTFIREDGSKKNLMLGICPAIGGNISNVTITKNKFYMNNTTAIMNREIVRIGGVLDTNKYPFKLINIQLSENEIVGPLAGCKAIVVKKEETNQASVLIKKNKITNTGSSKENSYGIIATGPNVLINNEIEGVETPYATDEETVFKTVDETEDMKEEEVSVGQVGSNREWQNGEGKKENGQERAPMPEKLDQNTVEKISLKASGKKEAIKLKWKKVEEAEGYVIYGGKSGKKLRKLKTIKNPSTISWTHKKLKKGTTYQYIVKAYVIVDGKKKWIGVSSKTYCNTKGNSEKWQKAFSINQD